MFLVFFAPLCVFVLCFDTGCVGVLLWVLQPSAVGDPLLPSLKTIDAGNVERLHTVLLICSQNKFHSSIVLGRDL